MSKYESAIISKANKRLDRMYRELGGSHESLDKLEFGIGMITGVEPIGVPKLYLRGLNPEQRSKMLKLAESYIQDPYSTMRGTKAMMNKGFKNFASDRNLTNNEVVALAKMFDDPRWQRLLELERTASEQIIEMVQLGTDKGMKPKEITDSIYDWLKNGSEYEGSFYDYMNEKIIGRE